MPAFQDDVALQALEDRGRRFARVDFFLDRQMTQVPRQAQEKLTGAQRIKACFMRGCFLFVLLESLLRLYFTLSDKGRTNDSHQSDK